MMRRSVELTGLAYRKHYDRDDARPVERAILRYMDVITSDTDPNKLKVLPAVHSLAHSVRNVVGRFNVDKHVPKRIRQTAGDRIAQSVMLQQLGAREGSVSDLLDQIEELSNQEAIDSLSKRRT